MYRRPKPTFRLTTHIWATASQGTGQQKAQPPCQSGYQTANVRPEGAARDSAADPAQRGRVMSDSFSYDVYLSYNSADKRQARRVAERLREVGLRVWFDEWIVQPGDDIFLAIERGLDESRTLILCMSPNALDSGWVALERNTALFRDPTNEGRRFVPLLLADCKLPDVLRRYRYIDLRHETQEAWDELMAACRGGADAETRPRDRQFDWLSIPERQWNGRTLAALLRADHAIVPFHGRQRDLETWKEWATGHHGPTVQLITGSGGMGKTRLAQELCRQLRGDGLQSGFLDAQETDQCVAHLKFRADGRMLLVVDYAESHVDALASILRVAARRNLTSLRLLLLARGAGYWWSKLKRMGDGVGDQIDQEPTRLQPLTLDIGARKDSYAMAASAFAERLGKPIPVSPEPDLAEACFERTLLLHMSALLAVEGAMARGLDPILGKLVERETEYWGRQLAIRQLPPSLEAGFSRAMGVISACGGVRDRSEAIEVIGRIRFFRDQTRAVVEAVADTLHDCYPGPPWIESIQPDLLMEYLIAEATRADPADFADIVLS